jgi:hypothetical protein
MLIILTTQVIEIRKIRVQDQLRLKVHKSPSQPIKARYDMRS